MTGRPGRRDRHPSNGGAILFVHNAPTKFVRLDLGLISEGYEVHELYLADYWVNPIYAIREVAWADLVYCWFASWHALLPVLLSKLLKKPSVVVAGGYDVANLPTIRYGHQRKGLRKWLSRSTLRTSSQVIAISEFSKREAIQNAQVDPDKVRTVYLGLDYEEYSYAPSAKEPLVITVGKVDESNLLRKGLEPFVRSARYFPEIEFIVIGQIIGRAGAHLRAKASDNVTFTGLISEPLLLDYLRRAQVYVQASLHEGFGLSVAEAMLCGCVPVVTRIGALPEGVGDAGIYLRSADPNAIAEGVRVALDCDETWMDRARRRILVNFTLQRRREELGELLEMLLGAASSYER